MNAQHCELAAARRSPAVAAFASIALLLLLSVPRAASAVDHTCHEIGYDGYGCCDGGVLWGCNNGTPYSGDCGARGLTCNYRPDISKMGCSTEVVGTYPAQFHACPVCTADCAGRTCGDDGCGGSCGSCGAAEYCTSAGTCKFTPLTCAEIGGQGCCSGNVMFQCFDGVTPKFGSCDPSVCNVADPDNPNIPYPTMTCNRDFTPHPSQFIACPPLHCTAKCTGRQCGSDGCAGSCGTCPAGLSCDANGQCKGTKLTAANIGPKFCCAGTTVWFYASNYVPQSFDCATTSGYCDYNPTYGQMGCMSSPPGTRQEYAACPGNACTPRCSGRTCGPDGCGGTCGACLSGQSCSSSGKCEGVCTPYCPYGTTCGDDGCGGSCGSCASAESCDQGQCVGGVGSCGSMKADDACCDGTHLFHCESDTRLLDYNCGKAGGYCARNGTSMGCSSTPGFAVEKTTCAWACQPQCAGKTCGPDGCGGVCGTCFPGQTCSSGGVCGTCQRNCINKLCGDDGCGGSCGACGSGLSCDPTLHECVLPSGSCANLSSGATCCSGSHVRSCLPDGRLTDFDCAPGATCGAKGTSMGCTLNAAIDQNYRYCPGACTPDCNGKNCGSDGCNGSCGTCSGTEFCSAGQKCQCRPLCNGADCGDDSCGGSCGTCAAGSACAFGHCQCISKCDPNRCGGPDGCGGTCPSGCAPGKVCAADLYCHAACHAECGSAACGDDGCGGSCGACPGDQVCEWGKCFPKPPPPEPNHVCTPDCTGRLCGDDGCGGTCGTCAHGMCTYFGKCSCYPDCTGKICGDDGCGGSCGGCSSDTVCKQATGRCVCAKQCAGKQCGDDSCGGDCGTCPRGYACNGGACECTPHCSPGSCGPDGCGGTCGSCAADKMCLIDNFGAGTCQCKPKCDGKTCGDNGCGGVCGTCPSGTQCGATGQCECAPKCSVPYRSCGPDGCGGTCGVCATNAACNAQGRCQCVPNCLGKHCGPDGCGGICGSCDANNPRVECEPGSGQCICKPSCNGRSCGDDGCGGSCGSCASDKTCAYVDSAGARACVCKPQCDGKACGPDGCGGVCGYCPSGRTCSSGAQCECVPKCSGKQCGSDGCGGICGTCTSAQTCDVGGSGQCLNCLAKCDGRTCGSDGCGGSCGACAQGDSCGSDGQCYNNRCPNTPDVGCCWGDSIKRCSKDYGPYFQNCSTLGKYCGWDGANSKFACVDSPNPKAPSNAPARNCPGAPVCTPDCTGRTCGDDGCGGTCGSCGAHQACDWLAGKCKADPCEGLPAGGCCEQKGGAMTSTLFLCDKPTAEWENLDCTAQRGSDGKPRKCGWSASDQKVACVNSSTADDPAHLALCPSDKCVPHCHYTDSCGSDGCGGSCGNGCLPGWTCKANADYGGTCQAPCSPRCSGKTCGSDSCGGTCGSCAQGLTCNESVGACVAVDPCNGVALGSTCCNGQAMEVCKGGPKHLETTTCTNGDYCGWDYGISQYACGHNGGREDATGNHPRACPGAGRCVPQCSGKQCGADGCGGTCGTCSGPGETCNDFGQCEQPCADGTPTGGCCVDNSDGTQARRHCAKPGGTSSEVSIEPCTQGVCAFGRGDKDRMGYRCGGYGTDPSGAMKRACPPPPACRPQCKNADGSAKECGDDGCGGTCGSCTDPKACDTSFKCSGPSGCSGTTWQGNCGGTTLNYCAESQLPNTDGFLMTQDCAASSGYCGWNEGLGAYSCETTGGADPSGTFPSGSSCRRCYGRECGADGCGGSCGGCASGKVCGDNGKCMSAVKNTCEGGRCGSRSSTATCQCDDGCVSRGDCCATYGYYCTTRQPDGSGCGNQSCESKGGENCASCEGDCGKCVQPSTLAPPWSAPYAQFVSMAGTPAQHAEALVDPLDRVLPAPPPYPLEGLLAYVPRAGVNAGPPTALVLSDKIGSTGAPADVTGAQGTGIGFKTGSGSTLAPNYGVVRVIPDGVLPRKPSFKDGQNGGFSIGFWAKVPADAPDVLNPLVGMRSAIETNDYSPTTKMFCAKARPRDGRIDIKCPKVFSTQLNVLQVRTYYGSVTKPGTPGDGTCSSFEALGANANCGSNELQAVAEAACVGKSGCSFNPGKQLKANTCTQAPFTIAQAVPIVEAFCGTSEATDGPALYVEQASGGNKIGLHIPGWDTTLESHAAVKDGKWHHVALTYQPYPQSQFGGLATLYVDGQQDATGDQLNIRPFSEVLIGAARQGSLDSAATKPSNYRSGSLAAIADLDEVFVYDRAIAENEVQSLVTKKENRLVRVWPALPPDRIALSGAGISGGAAKTANVEASWLLDLGQGSSSAASTVPLRDPHRALSLPTGVMLDESTLDTDLSGLTAFTFGGWVRVPALTATGNTGYKAQTLMRLTLGPTEQVAIVASNGCGGGGGISARVNGANLKPFGTASCLHNLKAGEWAFVAYTQDGTTRRLIIDGFVADTYNLPAFTLFGTKADTNPRTFETGDGVDLLWAGLFDRALAADELEVWRSQGPAAWFDGAVYTDTSGSHVRDYANFHHNRESGGVDAPRIFTLAGKASTAAASAAPLVLSKSGNGAISQVTIPANGRGFRSPSGLAGPNLKTFSWAGRVTVPPMINALGTFRVHRLPLVSYVTAPLLGGTGSRPTFGSWLVCDDVDSLVLTSLRNVYCHIEVTALKPDGWGGVWKGDKVALALKTPGAGDQDTKYNPFDVDVALSYEGTEPKAYLGTIYSGKGKPEAFSVTNANQTIYDDLWVPPTATPYFRVNAGLDLRYGEPSTDDLTVSNIRLYPRLLSAVEMQRLTTYDCASQQCGARGRSCVAGTNLTVPECGGCDSGFEGSSAPGGHCFAPLPFLARCINDVQCATGVCASALDASRTCASPKVDTTCTKNCAALGRECVASETIPAYATCSTWCAANFDPRDGNDGRSSCSWSPTHDDGEECTGNTDCKSGACVSVTDYNYDATKYAPDSCAGVTSCPKWVNSNNGNQPFACKSSDYNADLGYYGGSYCPPYATSSIKTAKGQRCAGVTSQVCDDNHQQATLYHKAGLLSHDAYVCQVTCSPETYDNKPLWVQAYKLLLPTACQTMVQNATKRAIEGRGSWFAMYNEPDLVLLKQLLLDKEGVVTPAEWSQMQKLGVGDQMLGFVSAPESGKQLLRDRFGRFLLSDCTNKTYTLDLAFDQWKYVTDPRTGSIEQVTTKTYTSPFFDPDFNALSCAANKFPDGSVCPPPNAGDGNKDKRGDTFCDSGFCGRDTGTCETGFGRLEKPEVADRGDASKQPEGGSDFGPMKLIQTNKTTMEVRKVVRVPATTGAAVGREYTLTATNKQALSFFGSDPSNLLDLELTMHAKMDEDDADFDSKIFVFDIQMPGGQTPATGCSEQTWENGKYKKPKKPCSLPQDATEMIPDIPQFQLCIPAPGGCHENETSPPIKPTKTTERGPLCWRQITMVGPVPITIEASVTIDACIGIGSEIDSETMEPGFQITPSLGLGLDLRGGVGGEIGPVEVFAGVHAAITIVEIAFPLKWAVKVEAIDKDSKNQSMSNMYDIQFYRGISAELTVLKLVASLFAEAGVSIFKVSWDYVLFQFAGLKFVWDLDEHTISSVKLDLEHPTADQ